MPPWIISYTPSTSSHRVTANSGKQYKNKPTSTPTANSMYNPVFPNVHISYHGECHYNSVHYVNYEDIRTNSQRKDMYSNGLEDDVAAMSLNLDHSMPETDVHSSAEGEVSVRTNPTVSSISSSSWDKHSKSRKGVLSKKEQRKMDKLNKSGAANNSTTQKMDESFKSSTTVFI